MSQPNRKSPSFASLDIEKGWPELPPAVGEEYPLPAWYRTVCDIPIDELGVEDICKACRQKIHLDHTVQRALRLLRTDPLAGESFDGELLAALKSVPREYWSSNEAECQALRLLARSVAQEETIPPDVREDAKELLTRIG
jgi:hypothetical protein